MQHRSSLGIPNMTSAVLPYVVYRAQSAKRSEQPVSDRGGALSGFRAIAPITPPEFVQSRDLGVIYRGDLKSISAAWPRPCEGKARNRGLYSLVETADPLPDCVLFHS